MRVEATEAYDETISNDVSLSKILDAFIIEDESPAMIVAFLEQHDDSFKDIISYSLHWTRMFQLDFMLQCKGNTLDYMVKKLKSIPGKIAAFCCWQICKSESLASQEMKWRFRKEMTWILSSFNTCHPYRNFTGKSISRTDCKLYKACSEKRFPEALNELSLSEFESLVTLSSSSLFKYRIYSLDVFQALDYARKWIFLNSGSYEEDHWTRNFMWQLLDSSEDIEAKKAMLCVLDSYYAKEKCMHPYDEYAKCKTFSEMWLKMTLEGSFNALEMLKLLIMRRNWKVLAEWAEKDKESMNNALNVSEVIRWMWMKEKAEKKKAKKGKKH